MTSTTPSPQQQSVQPTKKTVIPRWGWWLLGFASIGIIFASLIRVIWGPSTTPIDPNATIIPQSADVPSSVQLTEVRYTGDTPSFPSQLPILQIESVTDIDQVSAALIERYQLTPVRNVANTWATSRFSLQTTFNSATLINNDPALPSPDTETPRAGQLLAASQSIIDQLPLPTSLLVTQTEDISYFAASSQLTPASHEEAGLFLIPYTITIEDIPVFWRDSLASSISVLITKTLQLQRLDITPFVDSISPISSRRLISLDQALDNISDQKGSILLLSGEIGSSGNLNSVRSATFDTVNLEYRVPVGDQLLIPFFRFEGTATNFEGESFLISVTTSAI